MYPDYLYIKRTACGYLAKTIDSGLLKTYPLKGSGKEKFAGKRYGSKQFPNVTFTNQYILYNFPISSNIYRINIETGKESAFGGKSRYTPNMVSELTMPYNMNDVSQHIIDNVHFFEIQHDPQRNIYYRLHLDKSEYSSTIPFNTLYDGKKLYLTSFDDKFRITSEVLLDKNTYNYFNSWGVMNKGLFLTKDNSLNEDKDFELFQLVVLKPVID